MALPVTLQPAALVEDITMPASTALDPPLVPAAAQERLRTVFPVMEDAEVLTTIPLVEELVLVPVVLLFRLATVLLVTLLVVTLLEILIPTSCCASVLVYTVGKLILLAMDVLPTVLFVMVTVVAPPFEMPVPIPIKEV